MWKRRRWFQKSEPDFGGFLQILVCSESETVRDSGLKGKVGGCHFISVKTITCSIKIIK